MAKLVNLTQHKITLLSSDSTSQSYNIIDVVEPSGTLCRVAQKTIVDGEVNGLPLTHLEFGELQGLPEAAKDTLYIVSLACLQAGLKVGRTDLVCVSDVVRSADRSTVIGAKALSH